MKFIGRKREMEKLESEYSRDSSFVVIYGRRRVGKTTLIKEFLKDKTAFYFLATEEIESQSMKRLAGVVARTTKNRLLQNATFTDWLDLFQVIADYEPEKLSKLILENQKEMYVLAYSILKNQADAQDAVSECIVRAFENRTSLKKRTSARSQCDSTGTKRCRCNQCFSR